ncbi:MAG TPA: hypothetical protein DCO77_11030 [Nitrospiraceae bacterium]|nr:hypothetical protein [Nitrospiraceae bacterium]
MKRKIFIGLGLLLGIFVAGSVIAVLYITQATGRMDRLIMLHQVEIQRESVIIHVQQVQSNIQGNGKRSSSDVDLLIAHVQEMDREMNVCMDCHHAPDLTQGLMGMRDLAADYKSAISQFLTTSANQRRIRVLEGRAKERGDELISLAQGMAFTANVHLQKKTQETLASIQKITFALIVMLVAGVILAFVVAYRLAGSVSRPLQRLLDATRRIAARDLSHRVDIRSDEGEEFRELGQAFNTMTQNLYLSQRQLVRSTKLAAIGELATNIAYEVNSPLTGVLGYTSLLLKAEDVPEDKKEFLRTVESETLRARDVVKNLLDFGRRKPPQLIKTAIDGILEDALALVKSQAQLNNVAVQTTCTPGLPAVLADPEEMKQVFVNLMNNAFVAMPKGGELSIQCRQDRDFTGKDVIAVELADTGNGIPDADLDKIFDPFFTSGVEGGTGLGLSVSYLIVQNHGGRIEVESTPGKGARFTVILPLS